MKKIAFAAITAVVLSAAALPAMAQVWVDGYVKQNGTYVAPHIRSSPGTCLGCR